MPKRTAVEFVCTTGVVVVGLITSAAALYWGGVYDPGVAWLQAGGALLWPLLAAVAAIALRENRRWGDPLDLIVLLFAGYAVVTYFRTPVEYSARIELLWVSVYAAVFFFMRYGVESRFVTLWLFAGLLVTALGVCVYGLVQLDNSTRNIWGTPWVDYGPRISGTFGCPNHFADFMVVATMIAVFLGTYSRLPVALRVLMYGLATIFTTGLVLSASRGGYMAWAAGQCVVTGCLLANRRLKWPLKLLGLLGVAVAAGTLTYFILSNPYLRERVNLALAGRDLRVELAKTSLAVWKTSPLWGTGMATYDDYFLRHQGPDPDPARAVYAHNDYLNALADYGAVGLALVLVFVAGLAVVLVRRSFRGTAELERLVARTGLAVLAVLAMHSALDFSFHIPACALAFCAIAGASVTRTPPEQSCGGPRWRTLAPVILVLGLVAPVFMAVKLWQTKRGMALLSHTDEQYQTMTVEEIDALGNRGYAADPHAFELLEEIGDVLRARTIDIQSELWQIDYGSETWGEKLRERDAVGQVALKYYTRALEANPLDDALLVEQGMVYDMLERYPEAHRLYARAIENQPHNAFFHYATGFHLAKRGCVPEAIALLEKARTLPSAECPSLKKLTENVLESLKTQHHSGRLRAVRDHREMTPP